MRFEYMHRILRQEHSRFDVCRTASAQLRLLHKPGTRIGDSIERVLYDMAGPKAPRIDHNHISPRL